MADTKISALSSVTVAREDLLPVVDDPAGTPITKRSTVGDAIALVTLPFITGGTRYYTHLASGTTNNQSPTINTLYAAPIYVPSSTAFDRIAVTVATGGSAGSVVRMGVYQDGGGKPTTLQFDAGTVATTGSGFTTITISQTFGPGWFWLASVGQVAVPSLTHVTGISTATAQVATTSGYSLSIPAGFSVGSVSGALPDPWGSTLTEVVRLPLVYLRAT